MIAGKWFPGWRPAPAMRAWLDRQLDRLAPLLNWRFLILTLAVVGIAPVMLSYWLFLPFHQPHTAILLAPLLLHCVREDRLFKGLLVLGGSLILHSATVIWLSAMNPATEQLLPGAAKYWEGIFNWISTGHDKEYEWTTWLPEHLKLFIALPVLTYLTFGMVPLWVGVEQLDLMNYYVGRLIPLSESSTLAVLYGWHPWSLLRGSAYTILIFEVASFSLERFLGRPLSTRRRRLLRWFAALVLAIADALVKLYLAPILREHLFANLRSS